MTDYILKHIEKRTSRRGARKSTPHDEVPVLEYK